MKQSAQVRFQLAVSVILVVILALVVSDWLTSQKDLTRVQVEYALAQGVE